MRSIRAVYVATEADCDKHQRKLAQMACPRCHAVGYLIRHGYLWGYGEAAADRIRRGWRVFCSDRGRKQGCGRTYAILLAHHLYRRFVGAGRLWKFLAGVLAGNSIKQAWETVASPLSLENGYHLWASFLRNQTAIRVVLHSAVHSHPLAHIYG
jgi:hypothetical protein